MKPFTQNAQNANFGPKNIAAKYALHLDFADQLVSSDKPKVVIASPAGRGNPVGDVTRDAGAMRWVAGWFGWIAASGLCPSSQ